MKPRAKPALQALPANQVQTSLPPQGVLRDLRHAFVGLCIDASQKLLAALVEPDRIAVCGAKGVPDGQRREVRGGSSVGDRRFHRLAQHGDMVVDSLAGEFRA